MTRAVDYEVAVIGGGPGGYRGRRELARKGHRVACELLAPGASHG